MFIFILTYRTVNDFFLSMVNISEYPVSQIKISKGVVRIFRHTLTFCSRYLFSTYSMCDRLQAHRKKQTYLNSNMVYNNWFKIIDKS